jgi:hypothetical protein
VGACKRTSFSRSGDVIINEKHTNIAKENSSNSEEQSDGKRGVTKLESKSNGNESGFVNKSKRKRNRRKERKKYKVNEHSFKVIGVNAAGLMSKLESFEKL